MPSFLDIPPFFREKIELCQKRPEAELIAFRSGGFLKTSSSLQRATDSRVNRADLYPGGYENGITRQRHMVGDKTFTEETLPVESVGEYFEHFSILEIDYTFYRPLLESKGSASSKYHALNSYRQQKKKEDLVLPRAP